MRAIFAVLTATFLVAASPSWAEDSRYAEAEVLLRSDPARARSLFEELAASGNADAMSNLAVMLDRGEGGPQDRRRAAELMERAAAAGSNGARLNLGVSLMYDSDPAQQERAYALLSEAAKDPKAKPFTLYPLGRMTLLGIGTPPDLVLGATLLKQALEAEPDNADANYLVGRIHQNGWGDTPRDPARAYAYFIRAAEAEDPRAMRYVGLALLRGDGVPQDQEAAYGWFLRAAGLGHRTSMIDVAVMLALGEGGIAEDDQAARSWYLKAAELGSAQAIATLGWMLSTGEGGPIDLLTARAYLELGAAAGYEAARAEIDEAPALSAADRRQVDAIKSAWLAKHPPPDNGD